MSFQTQRLDEVWESYQRGWFPADKQHRYMSAAKKTGHMLRYMDGEAFGKYRFNKEYNVVYHDGGVLTDQQFSRRYEKMFIRQYDIVLLRACWSGLKVRIIEDDISPDEHYTFSGNYIVIRSKLSESLRALMASNYDSDVIESVRNSHEINSWYLLSVLYSTPVQQEFNKLFSGKQFCLIEDLKAVEVPNPPAEVKRKIALAFREQYREQTIAVNKLNNHQKVMTSLLYSHLVDM